MLILASGILLYAFRKKLKKNVIANAPKMPKEEIAEIMTDDKEKVINIIRRHGNRTTQKDIRKEMPLSEAKVSLIIAELEHEGSIKKIKKGRGNIIIFNEQNNQVIKD